MQAQYVGFLARSLRNNGSFRDGKPFGVLLECHCQLFFQKSLDLGSVGLSSSTCHATLTLVDGGLVGNTVSIDRVSSDFRYLCAFFGSRALDDSLFVRTYSVSMATDHLSSRYMKTLDATRTPQLVVAMGLAACQTLCLRGCQLRLIDSC